MWWSTSIRWGVSDAGRYREMTVESQNPYQSPTAVDQPTEVVELPGVVATIGRAAGLGLLGAVSFASIALAISLRLGPLNPSIIQLQISIALATGLAFGCSEILRIGPDRRTDATTIRILGSIGIFAVSLVVVVLAAVIFWPDVLLLDSVEVFSLGFWGLAAPTIVVYLLGLFLVRAVGKSMVSRRWQSRRTNAPGNPANGE